MTRMRHSCFGGGSRNEVGSVSFARVVGSRFTGYPRAVYKSYGVSV